jgi:putative hydroxymethylpyrimidine transport system ATP-binding protein
MTFAPAVRLAGTARLEGAPLFGPLAIELGAGTWTCLLGASGVGKSTVLRLIAGLPTGVAFHGTVTASDRLSLDGRVAYMAQSDLLFPWLDVLGNVTLGARLRGAAPDVGRARGLLDRVGLSARADRRPRTLSGGERQRAALARTLMEDRPVILLDEPFSALDARTRAEMQELAAELLAGRTVLLVTHDPGEAARLGHAILLMSPTGVTEAPLPPTPPIRPADDPGTLAAQGRLLAMMRAAA